MDRRVTLAENLGYDLYVTDVRCAKGTSAYCTFQANVVNNTARELWVEWRVAWLDANGIEIDAHDLTWTVNCHRNRKGQHIDKQCASRLDTDLFTDRSGISGRTKYPRRQKRHRRGGCKYDSVPLLRQGLIYHRAGFHS